MFKSRKAWLAGIALLVPATALAYWLVPPVQGGDIINLGYRELSPPSRLFAPGAIITVEELSDGKVQLHHACRMDWNELMDRTLSSPTVDVRFVHKVSRSVNANAKLLSERAVAATGKRVRGIAGAISNLEIHTMSYQDIEQIRRAYVKGDCEQSIIHNLRAGARVCQLEEVLQGDIVYTLTLDEGLEIDVQADLIEEVGTMANLENTRAVANDVIGEDLLLGIKAKRSCLTLNDDQVPT